MKAHQIGQKPVDIEVLNDVILKLSVKQLMLAHLKSELISRVGCHQDVPLRSKKKY